jgi:hypothetical protein
LRLCSVILVSTFAFQMQLVPLHIGGFEGIAWWAAPSMSVVLFDQDEGIITNDVDALSILSLPLIHPNSRRPTGGMGGQPGEGPAAPPSTLASSVRRFPTRLPLCPTVDSFSRVSHFFHHIFFSSQLIFVMFNIQYIPCRAAYRARYFPASMWSSMSIDDMLPDQFDDLSKYRVGLVEPEWHHMRQGYTS